MGTKRKEEVINELVEELQGRVGDRKVAYMEVTKNNGVKRDSIVIDLDHTEEHPGKAAANHYIDIYMEDLLDGSISISRVADMIIDRDLVAQEMALPEDLLLKALENKEFTLSHVHRCLINRDANKQMLEKLVSRNYLDLAVVYRVFIDNTSSFALTNDYINIRGITAPELESRARENDKLWWTCDNMNEAIRKRTGYDPDDLVMGMIHVATNKALRYGAAVMLEHLGECLMEDSYIFPSSVHELICIPCKICADIDGMKTITEGLNLDMDKIDVLSDNVYHFDAATKKISIV